jgi:hypothetical protein
MPHLTDVAACSQLVIQIGDIAACVTAHDAGLLQMLENRYAGFVASSLHADFHFEVDVGSPQIADADAEVCVKYRSGWWTIERGDFRAEWDSASRRGKIRSSRNPYSIDALLRILHTLTLAKQGGFLLHAASAIRNGKAFVFTGPSGAGKTTIASLAPSDAILLTDEISYVRKHQNSYIACGTPFVGELRKLGKNVSAPLAAVYVLAQGPENRIDSLSSTEAAGALLSNLLFFAKDQQLVDAVFHAVCEFVGHVPVFRLTFFPDSQVWGMIQ